MVLDYKFYMRGVLHQKVGDPYEDFYSVRRLPHGKVVSVADGMGSCARASLGSRCAAHAASWHVARSAPKDSASPTGQICAAGTVASSFSAAAAAVEREARTTGCAVDDLGTTLMVATFEGPDRPLCYGHVGDGAMIARYGDGSLELLEEPQRGSAGGTYSVGMGEAWRFGTRYGVRALLVTTDGLRDAFVEHCADGTWRPTELARCLLGAPASFGELDRLFSATQGTDVRDEGIWASTDDRTVYLAWWQADGAEAVGGEGVGPGGDGPIAIAEGTDSTTDGEGQP